jgi:hypothetical protein
LAEIRSTLSCHQSRHWLYAWRIASALHLGLGCQSAIRSNVDDADPFFALRTPCLVATPSPIACKMVAEHERHEQGGNYENVGNT